MKKITKKVLLLTLSLSILTHVSPASNARLLEKKSVHFNSSFKEKGIKSIIEQNSIEDEESEFQIF